MSPEVSTLIANVQSMLDQLKQLTGGETEGTEDKAISAMDIEKILKEIEGSKEDEAEDKQEMAKKAEDEKSKEDKAEDKKEKQSVEKGFIQKLRKAIQAAKEESPDKGTTAEDGAEEIIDEQGDVNEENLKEIAKSIIKQLSNKKKVAKSNDAELVKVIKVLVDEQNEIRKGLENIYQGLGIADEINKLNEVKKSESYQKPVNDPNEIKKSIDEIKLMLGTKENSNLGPEQHVVHKSLTANGGELLKGIFSKNSK